ncbi:PREDICTED: F-box only protein 30 [Nanorana parkeri]|uniref:F-box only protein 30 n=1 Tax=Nanorana parkeri TaxID=125878 RepID=UPI0008543C00|nr:PREDICTED: F-box only protein 30 [Nanorana parkeri]
MDEDNQHIHCASCVSRRCMMRLEAGVSCDLISCLHVCGAVFHSCKADEHQMLCPLERVPCLNQGFGCPFVMTRNKLAEHLQYCPANVVCCTMEWNRWPVSYADRTSYKNLSTDVDKVEQLDLALALQDQRMLLESLKVETMMSKTTEKLQSQEQMPVKGENDHQMVTNAASNDEDSYSALYQATLETTKSLAAALDILNNATREIGMLNGRLRDASSEINKNFQISEQNGGCDIFNNQAFVEKEDAEASYGVMCTPLKQFNQNGSSDFYPRRNSDLTECDDPNVKQSSLLCNGFHNDGKDMFTVVSKQNADIPLDSSTKHVNHNRSFRSVEQLSGPHTTNGSEEQMDKHGEQWFQNVAVFGRSPFLGNSYWFKARTENKAVDTSDLEVQDDPMGLNCIDLVTAAFLFCLGESPGGRGISDKRNVDSNRIDCGTQTFSFPSAILATNTMVGDIASACACDHANPQLSNPSPFQTLGLDLVLEYVAGYQVKQRSMFTFVCGQLFRRDEFSSHFKNVHADIHAGLNGWMEQRCPLAYYGCTYSQRRFCPLTQGSKIIHDRHLKSFGVQPHIPSKSQLIKNSPQSQSVDNFSSLPYEVLQHIAGFLDGFTLCHLSRVSRLMRDVCASLLQARGIVVLLWEKKLYPQGSSWQIKEKVWRFSTAFSTVKEWKFADVVSMADHLKKCSYNTVERREDAVPLPCMCVTRELTKEGRSLRSVLKPVWSSD